MTLLEKIVYIADYIEPKRDKAPNLAVVRKLAFEDLDECMYKILADTLAYLEGDSEDDIDTATKDAFLYYKDLHIKRTVLTVLYFYQFLTAKQLQAIIIFDRQKGVFS